MTPALRPARRHLLPHRRHATLEKDITGYVRALTRLLSVVVPALLVWIVILGVSLPTADTTRQWKLLWIGFDTAEVAGLGVALWAVYRSARGRALGRRPRDDPDGDRSPDPADSAIHRPTTPPPARTRPARAPRWPATGHAATRLR
jgi:hypothetical protein